MPRERRATLAQYLQKQDEIFGAARLEALGLSRLGAKLLEEWPLADQVLFGMGMLEKFKGFKHIKRRWAVAC